MFELQHTITRDNLENLVSMFYHKAMRDEQIGHYFVLELGEDIENDDWIEHIDILVDFWASVFLGDTLYKSDPFGPHFSISNLKPTDFKQWVMLFSQTADQLYTPEIATQFKEKSIYYSEDFIQRLDKGVDLNNLKSVMTWE